MLGDYFSAVVGFLTWVYNSHFSQMIMQQVANFLLRLYEALAAKVMSFWVRLTAGLVDNFTSIRRFLTSQLRRDSPLLPQTNADSQSIMQNPRSLKIGTLVFAVAIMATLGLIFFHELEDLVSKAYDLIAGALVFVMALLGFGLVPLSLSAEV